MSKPNAKPLTIDSLWEIERLANPALSPDGSQVVCSRTCYDQASNKTSSQLWLLSTLGGAPRQLTSCGDRDRQAAW
ncbi:MAG: S9 family peptidase, partial [Burkholderiales bacterium]